MTAPPDPSGPDLLVSGDDRPRRRWSAAARRRGVAAAGTTAVLAAAVGAAALVHVDRAADERRRLAAADRDVVRLGLLRPGERGGPRYGARPPGVQLVVVNDGPAPVRLLRGSLEPGSWRVSVPSGRELRPGRIREVELTPPSACGTVPPRVLRVEALAPSGRSHTTVFDLARARPAYGGTFEDAVAAAALGCDPGPGAVDGRTALQRS